MQMLIALRIISEPGLHQLATSMNGYERLQDEDGLRRTEKGKDRGNTKSPENAAMEKEMLAERGALMISLTRQHILWSTELSDQR